MRLPPFAWWGLLSLAVLGLAFMVVRDLAGGGIQHDLVGERAKALCEQVAGCVEVGVDPKKLEAQVAQFTMADGTTSLVLIVSNGGKVVGTVPLK